MGLRALVWVVCGVMGTVVAVRAQSYQEPPQQAPEAMNGTIAGLLLPKVPKPAIVPVSASVIRTIHVAVRDGLAFTPS